MADPQLKTIQQDKETFISKRMISRVIDYWYLFALSLAICLTLAWLKVYYATPMYKVTSQVLIEDNKNNNVQGLTSGNGGMDLSAYFSSRTNLQNEIGILQTTDLSKSVVKNMQLYISYYHKGKVRSVELYKGSPFQVSYLPDNENIVPLALEIAFPKPLSNDFVITANQKSFPWHFNDTLHQWGAKLYFTRTDKKFDPEATYLFSVQDPGGVAGQLAGNLTAELYIQKSSILKLTLNTNSPEKGIDVLYNVIQTYIDREIANRNRITDSTLKFINERIDLVGADLANIETTIQQFKQKNKIADLPTQSQILITNSSSYLQKQNELDVQLNVLETMLNYVQNEQNNSRPVPALLNSDATFSSLVMAYNAAQVQRDKLSLSLKDDNPLVSNLDLQIAGLRSDIIKSLRSQKEALTISRQQLSQQNSEANGLIRNVPEQERRFLDYSREQSVKQALYLFLLQKKEETAIAKAANVSNATIIESPAADYQPYAPSKNQTLLIGFIVGLVLPSVFIGLQFILNNKIQSREDVTQLTPVTILSEIGHSQTQGLLDLKDEGRSSIAEQFRIFRTNMDFALANSKTSVVMITSCLSGEGKSFIAANLGQIYAISGKKVLLMELDLRRPRLSKILNTPNNAGFSNYIISNRPVQEFIQTVGNLGSSLSLLSSGPIPPNPAELLLSDKMTDLFNEVKGQYDVIIVDTAPIGAVTDAQVVGKFADISLYVIRQGYSIKNSVEIVNDIVANKKLPSFYLILNDVKAGTSYRYGYGYGYGYGYSYSNVIRGKRWWQWRRR